MSNTSSSRPAVLPCISHIKQEKKFMQRKRDKIAEADVHMHISWVIPAAGVVKCSQDVVLVDGLVSPILCSEPFTY